MGGRQRCKSELIYIVLETNLSAGTKIIAEEKYFDDLRLDLILNSYKVGIIFATYQKHY